MFERFTDRARAAIAHAEREASELGHPRLGTEHVLLGLVHDSASVSGQALLSLGVTYDDARRHVAAAARPEVGTTSPPVVCTETAKRLLELSRRTALERVHTRIGTDDLMLSLLQLRSSTGLRVLDELNVDHDAVRARLLVERSPELSSERVPSISSVHVELSPQARELVRRGLRVGSSYVARRYASPRLVLGASKAAQIIRTLNAKSALLPVSQLHNVDTASGPTAISAAAPLVPAACGVCGLPSPECGTLFSSRDRALICERCAGEAPHDRKPER